MRECLLDELQLVAVFKHSVSALVFPSFLCPTRFNRPSPVAYIAGYICKFDVQSSFGGQQIHQSDSLVMVQADRAAIEAQLQSLHDAKRGRLLGALVEEVCLPPPEQRRRWSATEPIPAAAAAPAAAPSAATAAAAVPTLQLIPLAEMSRETAAAAAPAAAAAAAQAAAGTPDAAAADAGDERRGWSIVFGRRADSGARKECEASLAAILQMLQRCSPAGEAFSKWLRGQPPADVTEAVDQWCSGWLASLSRPSERLLIDFVSKLAWRPVKRQRTKSHPEPQRTQAPRGEAATGDEAANAGDGQTATADEAAGSERQELSIRFRRTAALGTREE